jgi:hypothetical protein
MMAIEDAMDNELDIKTTAFLRGTQPMQQRIDTTTQQIKNCVVAALHDCGLVERGPITATERQQMAIRTVMNVGRRATAMLGAQHATTTPGEMSRAAMDLDAVLDELGKEFGL